MSTVGCIQKNMKKNMGAEFSNPEEPAGAEVRCATKLGILVGVFVAAALGVYFGATMASTRRMAGDRKNDNWMTSDEPSGRKVVMSASEWAHYRRVMRRLRRVTKAGLEG
jgi:hypothetical protein